ncbi:MAG: glycosyltransferase family 2 protein [Lachnospiraceae bacterium]|nr:glycosyltransferase family 2 protein [Lachnospiraceae bacterium]
MDILYIVMPAYNEQDNIQSVLEEWYPIIELHNGDNASRLVVFNDGSTDNTKSILEKFAQTHPLFVPISKENSGHGNTVRMAYDYAISHGADYVFQTDSDGQTKASEFEEFWNLRHEYAFIAGWRKNRQDGRARIIVSEVLRIFVKLLYHTNVMDANVPYRLMNAKKLETNLSLIPEDYFLINVALSALFCKDSEAFHYIPITFKPRCGGKNSINMRSIIKIGFQFIFDFHRINAKILKIKTSLGKRH